MFNQTPQEDDLSIGSDLPVNQIADADLSNLNKDKNFPFKKVGDKAGTEDIFSTTDNKKEYEVVKPMTPVAPSTNSKLAFGARLGAASLTPET